MHGIRAKTAQEKLRRVRYGKRSAVRGGNRHFSWGVPPVRAWHQEVNYAERWRLTQGQDMQAVRIREPDIQRTAQDTELSCLRQSSCRRSMELT